MAARKRGRITVQSQPTRGTRLVPRLASIPFLIVSVFFLIIGVTTLIPAAGLFGVVWTLMAVCFVVIGIFNLVRKNGLVHRVGYDIESGVEQETIVGLMEDVDRLMEEEPPARSAEERLTELRSIYDRRLITREEYDAKRQEILEEL